MIKAKRFDRGRLLIIFCYSLIGLLAAAATAIGCAWSGTDFSVHFNAYRSWQQFGLPPLPKRLQPEKEADNSLTRWPGRGDWSEQERLQKEIDAIWQEITSFERVNLLSNPGKFRDRLTRYLELTEDEDRYGFLQERRNDAIDLRDALSALSAGSSTENVKIYFKARLMIHHDNKEGQILELLESIQHDANLKDNVLYLKAALQYHQGNGPAARALFNSLVKKYPHSEKYQAALFMVALADLKEYPLIREQTRAEFVQLIRRYPDGPYVGEAAGWLGWLSSQGGDRVDMLVAYYRMLASTDSGTRRQAVTSLGLVRHNATEADLKIVEARLANQPAVALAYAYYELYNYPRHSCIIPVYEDDNYDGLNCLQPDSEQYQNKIATNNQRVAAFATRLLDRFTGNALTGGFLVRLAMANLELAQNDKAAQLIRRALKLELSTLERTRALFVLGLAEYRQQHLEIARTQFQQLLEQKPTGRLMLKARENLAMISEDLNDLSGALEQYLILHYQPDIAYLVDAVMTPEQLADFISNHPSSPDRDLLNYSLGLRYLRKTRYSEASNAFNQVHSSSIGNINRYRTKLHRDRGYNDDLKPSNPKAEIDYQAETTGVRSDWLLYDQMVLKNLARLKERTREPGSDEEQAEALYQFASYQYSQGTLLYYNPALWQGSRYWNISELAAGGNFRFANEAEIIWQYCQEHETLAQALKIYLEIVDRYPNTRAARDAYYTAAVCHEQLSNCNPYWRSIYQQGLHAGSGFVCYQDVKTKYPHYQLPRGTNGWQPLTRTVYDRPGWAPKPKPPVRLSRWQRAMLWLEHAILWLSLLRPLVIDLQKHFWHWLIMIKLFATIMVAWCYAMRSIKLLQQEANRTGPAIRALLTTTTEPNRVRSFKNKKLNWLYQMIWLPVWPQVVRCYQRLYWQIWFTRRGLAVMLHLLVHGAFLYLIYQLSSYW